MGRPARGDFQEGHDAVAEQAYREIARLSRGRLLPLRSPAVNELRELLRVVAAYASGGMKALNELSVRRNAGTIKLLEQMR